jgi:hypothetical protein
VGTLFGLRAVRGLDCQETDDGGRVLLVVKLPPRYRPERLINAVTQLTGVNDVEWAH